MKWPSRRQKEQLQGPAGEGADPRNEASGERSVAISGDNYGAVLTGDNARAVTLPAEALRAPAQVPAPPGLDNLQMYPRLFVGRTSELERLDTALATSGGVVVQAVHGLGGVGKSTLAAHWAATRAHGHAPIRWINASSHISVQEGLAALATALQPALAQSLPLEALAERGLQWLATHAGWLLILDNVNDPADISPLLVRATNGRFLITTRLATTWQQVATVVRLDVLDQAEALDLVTHHATATAPDRDMDGAAELCAELGYLPLAVEQAGAYLAQNPLITPGAYLDLLAQYPAAMYRAAAVGTAPERTIARIWRVTLDQITAAQPLAADVLRILAWYAPDAMPASVLNGFADPPALHHAIGLLTAYSMLTPHASTNTLFVHRLVQAVARTPDPEDPHRTAHVIDQARDHATTQLRATIPDGWYDPYPLYDPDSWENSEAQTAWRLTLLPHADALADHVPTHSDTAATADLLQHAGIAHVRKATTTRGILLLQRALATRVRLLGDAHPDTLSCRKHLANVFYRIVGEPGRAVPLLEQNVAAWIRMRGEDDFDTLDAQESLAEVYLAAGEPERAVPLYEWILSITVRREYEDDALVARMNLAKAYQAAGEPARAVPLYERILSITVRLWGEDHPITFKSRQWLADVCRKTGALDRAITLYQQNLTEGEQRLHPDDPLLHAFRESLILQP